MAMQLCRLLLQASQSVIMTLAMAASLLAVCINLLHGGVGQQLDLPGPCRLVLVAFCELLRNFSHISSQCPKFTSNLLFQSYLFLSFYPQRFLAQITLFANSRR